MNRTIKSTGGLLKFTLAGVIVATAFQTWASFDLGQASNYAVLMEGGGSGTTLQFNNSTITGNVGIGGTAGAQLNGPGSLSSVSFSAANSGQYSDSGVTVGSVSYNSASVASALSTVNA